MRRLPRLPSQDMPWMRSCSVVLGSGESPMCSPLVAAEATLNLSETPFLLMRSLNTNSAMGLRHMLP